jgi:nucleotide-binding universal stress UspA family protein
MAIANIFVPLTGASQDAIVLATAFAAAKPFSAHVGAVFVSPDAREALPVSDWQAMPDVVQQLADARAKMTNQLRENARAAFAAATLQAQARIAPLAEKSDSVTASYREEAGRLSRVLDASTQFADLVVFPPLAGSKNSELHDAFIHMLLRAERTVLLSPESAPEHVGMKPAIGWDGGRAAAHALIAAMPFLESSRRVDLLCIGKGLQSEFELTEVKEYLVLHKVKVTDQSIARTGRPIGETLLDAAAGAGCDLIVVGGYGHSRTLETIFGGVTDHIASHARIPILMVH